MDNADSPGATMLDNLTALRLRVKLLRPDARPPSRGTPQSAGWDLHAAEACTLGSGETRRVATGIAVAVPDGHYGQILDRSGWAAAGVMTLAGAMDSDYRGEWQVVLHNTGIIPREIEPGDRIAQFVILPVPRAVVEVADDLPPTGRGAGGFGSTGR